MVLTLIAVALGTFSLGIITGRKFEPRVRALQSKRVMPARFPLDEVIDEFKDFAEAINGGLSAEAIEAIQVLRTHTRRKALPPAPPPAPPAPAPASYMTTEALLGPVLDGADLDTFEAMMNLCSSPREIGDTIRAFHAKGFRFSTSLRERLLRSAKTLESRLVLRVMFEEQDTKPVYARIR